MTDWTSLEQDLDDLAAEDPEVAAAAERLREVGADITRILRIGSPTQARAEAEEISRGYSGLR